MPFETGISANPTVQYGPYNRTSARYQPPAMAPAGQAPGFDMQAMLNAFVQMLTLQQQGQLQQQNQQNQADIGMQREIQGGIRRDIGGQPIDQTGTGPFGGPIKFKSAQERYNEMAGYPRAMVPPRTDVSNPYFAGPIPGSERPVGTPATKPKRKGASFGFGAGIGPM